MSFSIKRPVFAHDFVNPPTEDRSCDIDIIIADPVAGITLAKEAPGLQTRFMLIIPKPSVFGIADSAQATVEKGIKDLLLAFNLDLARTCMSTLGGNLCSAEVETKAPETKITVEETPKGKNIKISETLVMRSTVQVTIGTREEISAQQALTCLNRIIRVKRFSPNPALIKELNVGKALNEYENAMSTFDRLRIFKYLFNTIEFCANWTGTDYKDSILDAYVARIAKTTQQDVES